MSYEAATLHTGTVHSDKATVINYFGLKNTLTLSRQWSRVPRLSIQFNRFNNSVRNNKALTVQYNIQLVIEILVFIVLNEVNSVEPCIRETLSVYKHFLEPVYSLHTRPRPAGVL